MMGIEEGTCWDEHLVLYGNQFDNKFHNKKNKNTKRKATCYVQGNPIEVIRRFFSRDFAKGCHIAFGFKTVILTVAKIAAKILQISDLAVLWYHVSQFLFFFSGLFKIFLFI